jgi:glutathione S-transferase
MAHTKSKLVTFGRSHFCEKARWALDWHGIAYDEIGWPPGLHIVLAKRCGANTTTLPILLEGENVIQGSGAIIDWAESKVHDHARSLTPPATSLIEAQEIERRADQVIGVHVRRLAYSEMLPSHSHLVKPGLFLRASGWHRLVGNMMWPVARRMMIRMHDIRPDSTSESRSRLDNELDWLDSKLADGRAYLAGDRFSRVDITVASLLAEFARPKEMPVYHDTLLPDALAADVERWSKRPVMCWVIAQYRAHRTPTEIN